MQPNQDGRKDGVSMTIDELAFKCACEALYCIPAIDMSPREAHEIRRHATEAIKDVIGPELAAKDAEIERLKAEVDALNDHCRHFRDSHANIARGVKAALGLKYWPEFTGDFADEVARLVREAISGGRNDAEIGRIEGLVRQSAEMQNAIEQQADGLFSRVVTLERENAELRKHVPEDGNLPIVEEALREQETACYPHIAAIAESVGVPLTKENYAVLRGAWALDDLLRAVAEKVCAKNIERRKDAERYRWLRGYWWEMLVPYLHGEHNSLDDAIDALHL